MSVASPSQVQDALAQTSQQAEEVITSIRTVRQFTREENEAARWVTFSRRSNFPTELKRGNGCLERLQGLRLDVGWQI